MAHLLYFISEGDKHLWDNMKDYDRAPRGSLPPHLFTCADEAYCALIKEGSSNPVNQSIIIRYCFFGQ
jgi:myosin heavy subunit